MEDALILGKQKITSTFKANGRRYQLLRQMDDDLNFFRQMEDDLNFLGKQKKTQTILANGKRLQLFRQMEDNLSVLGKWKMTPIIQANE